MYNCKQYSIYGVVWSDLHYALFAPSFGVLGHRLRLKCSVHDQGGIKLPRLVNSRWSFLLHDNVQNHNTNVTVAKIQQLWLEAIVHHTRQKTLLCCFSVLVFRDISQDFPTPEFYHSANERRVEIIMTNTSNEVTKSGLWKKVWDVRSDYMCMYFFLKAFTYSATIVLIGLFRSPQSQQLVRSTGTPFAFLHNFSIYSHMCGDWLGFWSSAHRRPIDITKSGSHEKSDDQEKRSR